MRLKSVASWLCTWISALILWLACPDFRTVIHSESQLFFRLEKNIHFSISLSFIYYKDRNSTCKLFTYGRWNWKSQSYMEFFKKNKFPSPRYFSHNIILPEIMYKIMVIFPNLLFKRLKYFSSLFRVVNHSLSLLLRMQWHNCILFLKMQLKNTIEWISVLSFLSIMKTKEENT